MAHRRSPLRSGTPRALPVVAFFPRNADTPASVIFKSVSSVSPRATAYRSAFSVCLRRLSPCACCGVEKRT